MPYPAAAATEPKIINFLHPRFALNALKFEASSGFILGVLSSSSFTGSENGASLAKKFKILKTLEP